MTSLAVRPSLQPLRRGWFTKTLSNNNNNNNNSSQSDTLRPKIKKEFLWLCFGEISLEAGVIGSQALCFKMKRIQWSISLSWKVTKLLHETEVGRVQLEKWK